jgi:hypothetical protein
MAKASARQRSSVATLIPTSRETKSIAELSGGNSLATIRCLYACPYRATFRYPRPQRFPSYLGSNFSDTGGLVQVPLIARPWPSVAQAVGKALAEFHAPPPHRLIGDGNTTLGQEQLDISQAEAEHMVQPLNTRYNQTA